MEFGVDTLSPSSFAAGAAARRRERLAAHAVRAGCGVLRVNNSMDELVALARISRAKHEARSAAQAPSLVAQNEDTLLVGAFNRLESPQGIDGMAFSAKNSLLESMLRTTGSLVSRKS